MDIATMHIGMDVELQELNSAVFGKLQHPEKDYIINDVIVNLIRSAINKDDNTVSNIVSYQDIREYYHILEPFLKTTQLEHTYTTGNLFSVGVLPIDLAISSITSGIIYKDVKYKVTIPGTTDLTDYGGTNPPVTGATFTCSIADRTGNPPATASDGIYRILDAGDVFFNLVGAANNNPGTYFTADGIAAAGMSLGGSIEVIADTPTWAGGTDLIPVYNPGYNNILAIYAMISCGSYIASGALELNKMYCVIDTGATDLTSYGAPLVTSTVNSIFTCDTAGTPTWSSGTKLLEVKKVTCRLVKMQDTGNFLNHSFGTDKNSPICELAGGNVKVYHNTEFSIRQIIIDYVRQPLSVSYTNSVDSDVHSSLHSFIVKLAARQAAGIAGSKEYQSLVMESEEDKQAINK